MTAIAMEHEPAACPTERFVVVVFDGVSLGIMSFAFGVFDMAVHYGVRGHCGAAVANRLARSMVVPPHRPGGQAQYIESPLPAPDDSDPVGETMTWALAHLDQPLPVALLARQAGMSRRNFDRRFREITGNAALTWLTHQRVLRAQQLLEATRLPVEEVARRCGFSSAAALRQHFRRVTGTAPAAYRTTFSPPS